MRRSTPFVPRGLANRRLFRGRGRARPNLWVDYVDLVTSESEQSNPQPEPVQAEIEVEQPRPQDEEEKTESEDSIESDPSEDEPCEETERTQSHQPLNYVEAETRESVNKQEDLVEDATSRYVPIKYPIFPQLEARVVEEKEEYYWSLMGSRGLVLTAREPKREREVEKMIQLKGKDTELPGSPGFLPTDISAADYWKEMIHGDKSYNPYKYMLDYAEASAPFRVPIDDTKPKEIDTRSSWERVEWYRKPYGFTRRP